MQDALSALERSQGTEARLERVAKLVEGFESPFGLELLSTVHWVATREAAASDDAVIARTYEWGERKRAFSPQQIRLARRVLTEHGFL